MAAQGQVANGYDHARLVYHCLELITQLLRVPYIFFDIPLAGLDVGYLSEWRDCRNWCGCILNSLG